MKKAEAISILATSVRPREAKDRARYDEAVKMAIEALKSSEQNAETAQADHIAESGKKVSIQPERKKPVFKTGESVYHVSYADGTGGFKKNKWADWTCPDCGWFVGEQYIPRRHNQQKCNYCAKCGCAIDWSDADMRGEQDGRDD